MKRLLAIAIVLLFAASVFAADSVVTVKRDYSPGLEKVTFAWLANTDTGAVPATSTGTTWPQNNAGCISKVVTNPGTTAPTDDYDITLTDVDGVDLMGGELANRDTANSEAAVPKTDATLGCTDVANPFILNISNQSVSAAIGNVVVYIRNYVW